MRFQIILVSAFFVLSTNFCSGQQIPDDISIGKINKITNTGNARAAHTSTLLADGTVLIAGGMEKDGVLYDHAELFDPVKNSFVKLESKMMRKRVSHSATLLQDGRVLIVGGWSTRGGPETTSEIYEPKSKTFVASGNTKFSRSGHTANLLNSGKVLIAGGSDGIRNLSESELFDPGTGSFEPAGNLKSPRNVHSATTLKNGTILFAGGELKRGTILGDAEIFDPNTNAFTKVSAKMNDLRYKHDAVLLSDGTVLIFGGSDERDTRGRRKSAEVFDPVKQSFTSVGELNFARFKIAETSVLLGDGKVLIAGGNESAEIFDPGTKTFAIAKGSLGKSLHYSTVTLLKDGRALIVGGYEFVPSGEPTSTNHAWTFKI